MHKNALSVLSINRISNLMAFATTIKYFFQRIVWVCCAAVLCACGNSQQAFFIVNEQGQSLAVVRDQVYMGGAWESALIVGGLPRCQRRYALLGQQKNKFSLDVYRPEPGVFILNTGKRWYVTSLESCDFQQYQTPPPEPGELIGHFQVKNNQLQYVGKAMSENVSGDVDSQTEKLHASP